MSIFTALPQDMLQWEINRFLTHKDALAFNEVLKKDERVYKKLPEDYAIKHQIHISHDSYQKLATALQFSLERTVLFGWQDIPKVVKLLKKYLAWFKDPKNHVAIMYTKGRQERFLENIGQWTELDMELYENLPETVVEELRDDALDMLILVANLKFVRHVNVKDYKNAFE
jgi:hypothetical protein